MVARVVENVEVETVRNIKGPANRKAAVEVKMLDYGRPKFRRKSSL